MRISEEEKRGSWWRFAGPMDLGDFTRKDDRVVEVNEREKESVREKGLESEDRVREKSLVKKKHSLVSHIEASKMVAKVEGVVSKNVELVIGLYKRWSRRG